MNTPQSFQISLTDLMKDKPEIGDDSLNVEVTSGATEVDDEGNDKSNELLDRIGLDQFQDQERDADESDSDAETYSEESHTLSLPKGKKIKKPTQEERRLKSLLEQQQARLQALESEYAKVVNKVKPLQSMAKALYEHGTLKDRESIENYEHRLKEQLKEAEYAGDVEAKVEALTHLTKLNDYRQKLEAPAPELLNEDFEANYSPFDQGNQNDDVMSNPYYSDNFKDWYSSNPWLSIPHLADEAESIMKSLDGELALNNQMEYIDTPQYYSEITKRLQSKFKTSQRSQQSKAPRNHVPVGSGLTSDAFESNVTSEREGWKSIVLTPEEMETARVVMGFAEQSAGRPLTDAQKYERMKKHLYKMRKNYQGEGEIKLW